MVAPAAADQSPADPDGDGIRGPADRCPTQPGVDPHGCPPKDSDGDQVTDDKDRCPRQAGPIGNAGCPDTDLDRDGVPDRSDQCKRRYGRAILKGCPAPDGDADGIPDAKDRCKTKREVWNGVRDWDGCPDRPAARLVLRPKQRTITFAQRITFTAGDRAVSRAGAFYLRLAAPLLRRLTPGVIEVVVAAEYGLSYGDSMQRARRRAKAAAAALAKLAPSYTRIVVKPRGPDGRRRLELHFR